jgi:predicted 3-demethylubiquinone-9 3-methyltransferase (glyoxalase superfamily)
MQKIVTHLWFDDQAEEAAKFYVSIFKNSRIKAISRYPKSAEAVSGRPAGSVMTVSFELNGQEYLALNGGPHFKFSEAISLLVQTESQQELDDVWNKLLEGGGQAQPCGWLKDKYSLSWQISHVALERLVLDPDPAKVDRMFQAMLKMTKLDVRQLEAAAHGTL